MNSPFLDIPITWRCTTDLTLSCDRMQSFRELTILKIVCFLGWNYVLEYILTKPIPFESDLNLQGSYNLNWQYLTRLCAKSIIEKNLNKKIISTCIWLRTPLMGCDLWCYLCIIFPLRENRSYFYSILFLLVLVLQSPVLLSILVLLIHHANRL